jgi:hypothetical protein
MEAHQNRLYEDVKFLTELRPYRNYNNIESLEKVCLYIDREFTNSRLLTKKQKWFIYNNTKDTKCPFCGTKYNNSIPVLDLFYQFRPNVWKPENQRIVVYNNATLHQWHSNRNIVRNEKLTDKEKVSDGYFAFHNNKWVFVNQKLTSLKDVTEDKQIPIGSMVEITNGKKLLFSKEDGGRVAIITIANN